MAAVAAGRGPVFSDRYKTLVLGLLVAAYTFNFIDRTVIATIGQAIKVDLKLTDTELGLLGGFSFAVLYTVLGIPIARLAERWSRVAIISLAMVVWSGFTVACGFAASFAVLLALRVGVGVGEAGCSPPAHSLISDYFEPKRRASALSIYSFGIPLGAMIGAVAGGWLAKTYGWRVAFMAVGAPGVIMALVTRLALREPPRGHSDPPERPGLAEDIAAHAAERGVGRSSGGRSWLASELAEIAAVAKSLFGNWPVANMVAGVTLASFAGYGAGAFSAPYFIRAFGLDYATVGLIFGLIGGFSTGVGTLAGGFVSDRAAKGGAAWHSLVPAIGLAIATPIYIAAYLEPNWRAAAAILLVPGMFSYTYLGPTFGVVQNVVATRQRATATALLFFVLNFIALGGGPVFTGWIIDRFAAIALAHPAAHGLVASLGGLFSIAAGADFAHACPGGEARAGASAAAGAACKAALIDATRLGIVVTIGFYGWAALHYLLGAFGLAGQLRKAADERSAREA